MEGKPRTRADGEEQVNWSSESERAAEDEFNDKQPIGVDAIGGVLSVVRSQLSRGLGPAVAQFEEQAAATWLLRFLLPSTHGQATNFFPGNVNINSPSICGAEAEATTVVPEAFSKTVQKK